MPSVAAAVLVAFFRRCAGAATAPSCSRVLRDFAVAAVMGGKGIRHAQHNMTAAGKAMPWK